MTEQKCCTCKHHIINEQSLLECHLEPPQVSVVVLPVAGNKIIGGKRQGGLELRAMSNFPTPGADAYCSHWEVDER